MTKEDSNFVSNTELGRNSLTQPIEVNMVLQEIDFQVPPLMVHFNTVAVYKFKGHDAIIPTGFLNNSFFFDMATFWWNYL